jgi:hypothetical protein
MTEGTGQAIDPSGEARSVLQSAVTDYGARVLSNAAVMDGICEDRLPDWPREASLVSMAVRADVAAMLQQRAGGVGADTAVRLTAANLAESRSLDPAAAIWVVSEFARVLGYQVSAGLQPASGPPAPPDGVVPPAAAAGAAVTPPVPAPGAAAAPPAAGAYPPAGPPGEALTMPPGTPPAHPPTERAGYQETVTTGPGGPGAAPPGAPVSPPPGAPGSPPAGGPGYPAPVPPGYPAAGGAAAGTPGGAGYPPPAGPGPAPGGQGYPPSPGSPGYPAGAPGYPAAGAPGYPAPGGPGGPPPAARSSRRGLLVVGGIFALVILYVIVAGTAHLPPFTSASPKPTHTPSPRPTPSVSTFQPTAADRALAALIPADVSAGGSCAPVHQPHFGSTAEYHCSGAPSVPAGYVQYYMFGTKSAMNKAYSTFLSEFAHVSRDSGPCYQTHGLAAFASFGTCETPYSLGSTGEGRVAEYVYKGSPDISNTFTKDLLLVDMQGASGKALIKWWDHAPNWVKV